MEEEDKIKTSIYLPPSMRKAIQQRAVDLDVKDNDVMLAAITAFFAQEMSPMQASKEEKPLKFSEGNREWHKMLELILTKGSDRQVLGIQSNLEAFVGTIRQGRKAAGF